MIRTFTNPSAPTLNDPQLGGKDKIRLYFISGYPASGPLEIENVELSAFRSAMGQEPEGELSFHTPDGRFYNFRRKYIKRWMPISV